MLVIKRLNEERVGVVVEGEDRVGEDLIRRAAGRLEDEAIKLRFDLRFAPSWAIGEEKEAGL